MKAASVFFLFLALSFTARSQPAPYRPEEWPVYNGTDLGVRYAPRETRFRVWAPRASSVTLRLYKAGEGGDVLQTVSLSRGEGGTWYALVDGDQKNRYYTFQMVHDGKTSLEVPDAYAIAVGVNGRRGMIVNPKKLTPDGWAKDKRPALKNATDIVLYELHVRDLSMNANSGIRNKGKYLGLIESGTHSPQGAVTGVDHIRALGVTHVHLLPSFDHNSIDESKALAPFNWGYDPLNYNVPEGSYATNAADGRVRVKEFRRMVQGLHQKGLRVVMDVVYNHTSDIEHSVFHQFAPGYFHRQWPDGKWGNGSACGNETASERAMMRKFMIESVLYWAKEYHIDGFRFDLMGLHDIETMNAISDALHRLDPTIFIYGEGWTAGDSPLPEAQRAIKKNTPQLRGIAAFSDDIRDALRGPFSDDKVSGFVSGKAGTKESLKFGIVGSVQHPQIDYKKVSYSKAPCAKEPAQTINYVSCHDDPTLFDRIRLSNPGISEDDQIRMDKLAQTAVLTAQGVSFLHAGEEMLRTKGLRHNTYNAPDSVNALDWSRKTKYAPVFAYYQGLIALRRQHPAFRLPTAVLVREHLRFIDTNDDLLLAYRLQNAPGDSWRDIVVLLNGDENAKSFRLPEGSGWKLAADGNSVQLAGAQRTVTGTVRVPANTGWVLFR
ncbi:type I pullulanase [Flaviaesturariibacter flavus]|uniref:Type I pullulanase n=1 Tax=Flaviaesturariibacter flavus TaxID=2502780 RepID=A0A4R1BPW3_9BACT|nr:type I pullulanase [Flaviaesturariibacter flavus]TCJ19611.1 type I pullulanase [Flaviaesturariibacter flavus]